MEVLLDDLWDELINAEARLVGDRREAFLDERRFDFDQLLPPRHVERMVFESEEVFGRRRAVDVGAERDRPAKCMAIATPCSIA